MAPTAAEESVEDIWLSIYDMLRIFFLADCFMDFGGLEERLTSLAIALRAKDYEVCVFSRFPVPATNQYRQRLKAHDIHLISPPRLLADLAGNWDTKAGLIALFVKIGSPLLAIFTVPFAALLRRPLRKAWKSVKGAAGTVLGVFILKDYRDWLFFRTLDFYHAFLAADVVHIHGYRLGAWQGVAWGQKRKLPTIYEEHSSPSGGFDYQPQALSSLYQPTMLIAVSEAGLHELHRCYGPDIEAAIVPPIIDGLPVCEPAQGDTVRGNDELIVTCNARLIPEKGLDYLLLAAQSLVGRYPSLRFMVYGDGPKRADLTRRSDQLGLSRYVHFCGVYQRSALSRIMRQTDIFVLPSLSEALGLAIVEAMAYGKPVVATHVGGIPDLITDGVTGLLVPPANAEALAQALSALISDPVRCRQMGEAAYLAFRAKGFTADAIVGQMMTVYKRAIDRTFLGKP